MTLEEIGNYHLLCELLKGGCAGLYPQLEPISVESIGEILRIRTGKDFGTDVERWVGWFLKSGGTEALAP